MRLHGIQVFEILSALLLVTLTSAIVSAAQPPDAVPMLSPSDAGMDAQRLEVIDEIIREGLSQSKMPGCVVVVGRSNGVVLKRAWGFRQSMP